MAGPDPRWRSRIELAIRIAAPALDLALMVAERASRILAPAEKDPPARLPYEGEHAPRGLPRGIGGPPRR